MTRRLIGRDEELAAVEAFLDELPTGALLRFEGEPGMGKTALWREAAERGRRRGYRVLSSRPGESETALTYSALGDLLDDVLDEALLLLPAPRRTALERALLRVENVGRAPDQRAVALALRDALHSLAAEPLIVAVDDVQWLDSSSAAALAFALRRLEEAPVGVLTTRRVGEDPRWSLDPAPTSAEHTIRLAPLDEAGVDELIRTALGTSLPRYALHEVHRASGGNPLFAIELARGTLDDVSTAPRAEQIPVPATLTGLLGARIADLAPDVRQALLIVAAASHPTVALVESVLGSRQGAFDVLSAGVRAGILEVDRGRLRFTHPLLASVVYGGSSREERGRAHSALAAAVDDVEERARHLAQATELPDPEVARALDEAAARALARGAPAAAADFAEQAVRLTRSDNRDAIARRLTAAGDALWSAGETARARALLEEVVSRMAAGPARASVLRRLARARAYEDGFASAMEPLERALAEVGDDVRLRAALERDIALAIINAGDVRLASPHAQAAVELCEEIDDAELTADAVTMKDSVGFLLGLGAPPDAAARAHRLAFEGEDGEVHPGFLARAQILASILKWSDDFAGARAVLVELRRRFVEREEEGPLVPVLFHLGELECWAGNLAAASTIAEEVESTARRFGPGLTSQALYLSGLVAAVRGDLDAAKTSATEGLALAEGGRDIRLVVRNLKVLGLAALSVGDAAEAHRSLGRAAELAVGHGFLDPGFFRVAADAIEALIGVGDLERAEREAEELETLGRRLDRPWALATGARSRGLVAAARGDLAHAETALEQALVAHQRLPEPLERGRTLLALGSVHRLARHKRKARETLGEAVALFEALPASLWAERTRAESARIGGRVPAGDALTEMERRIAGLVAEGRSNAEVAEALVLSRKTVEWNLSNVYRKLGVRSRTELARKTLVEDR